MSARVTSDALRLPVRTLGLLGRFWAPLGFWFVLGYLVHDLVLRGAAWLAHRDQWLGFAGLSVGVLVLLSSTIMMFHAVRPGLESFAGPGAGAGGGAGGGSGGGHSAPAAPPAEGHRMVDEIASAILPFLIFYGAWGLFTDEVRTWGVHVLNQSVGEGITVLSVLGTAAGLPLAIAIGSWAVRAVLEFRYNRRGGRLLGVLVALFEANWMFFAVISVSTVIGQGVDWLTGRVAWVATREAVGGLVESMVRWTGGWTEGWLPASPLVLAGDAWQWLTAQFGADVADGLLLPLLWLTIAAVVFGEQMDADDRIVADSRLARADTMFRNLPRQAQLVADVITREVRDKWTPTVNGFRFVLRAGPLFYLTFCLLYVLVEAATGWAFIGVTHLVGAHPWDWWFPRLAPLEFAEQGVRDILHIALLAAAFETCRRRARTTSADQDDAPTAVLSLGGARGTAARHRPPVPAAAPPPPPSPVRRTR